jgi:hypothetical protein
MRLRGGEAARLYHGGEHAKQAEVGVSGSRHCWFPTKNKESKPFFSEEKNQKTFINGALPNQPRAAGTKVFCFFFSKKKRLPCLL